MADLGMSKQDGCNSRHFTWSRRNFTSLAGWGLVLGSIGAGAAAFARFMYPRALFEPSSQCKVGKPDEYLPNGVSEKWVEKHRFWLVRYADRVFAVSAVCTHLGCTPRWLGSEDRFRCPCHGSGFHGLHQSGVIDTVGVNFEGPAPRPLERFRIALAGDGQIVVDRSKVFRGERGEWDHPDASIRYVG